MIQKHGKVWQLLDAKGRVLGEHRLKRMAQKQERAIEAAKSERKQRRGR